MRADRRIFAILSALDWALGCAQISQLRRSSSASRAADYESSRPLGSRSAVCLYKRRVSQLCRGQYGRVFSVLAADGRDDGGPAEEHAAVRAMVAGRVVPGGISVAAAVRRRPC